jgi:hypothetical protein
MHLLENAPEDRNLRAPQREQLEQIIRKRALRRDPPIAVAPTPYGTIYQVSDYMTDDPKIIDLMGFTDPDFISTMKWMLPLADQYTATFYYVPDECVIAFESDRIMRMLWLGGLRSDKSILDFLILAANALSPKVEFDRVAKTYLGDNAKSVRDADVIRGKDGRWENIHLSLGTEDQKVLVPGLSECWNITQDWIHRARYWLSSRGVHSAQMLRNSNRFS